MNKKNSLSVAQGTIEYLIAISVVVVIGLIIVVLLSNTVSSPASNITSAGTKISQSSGGISILDAVVDFDGNGLISVINNTGGTFTLTRMSLGGIDSNYGGGHILVQGDKGLFELMVGEGCNCSAGEEGKEKVCNLEVYGFSEYNLDKEVSFQISVDCVSDVISINEEQVISLVIQAPQAPIVYLTSPLNASSSVSKTVDFNFNLTNSSSISRCELFVNGESDTNKTTGLVSGVNSIQKTFANDSLVDWNVSCYDNLSKIDSNSTWSLNVDSNSSQITTCLELQDMNKNPEWNFVLMNDINCYSTRTWNSGLGFNPVGYSGGSYCTNPSGNGNAILCVFVYGGSWISSSFTGSLNGNNHSINQLYINRLASDNVGLFGYIGEYVTAPIYPKVSNLKIRDANITGNNNVGTIGGLVASIEYSSVDVNSIVNGTQYVGLAGGSATVSKMNNSTFVGKSNGTNYVGGMFGSSGSVISFSSNSSRVDVNGFDYVGGIAGSNGGTISDINYYGIIKGRNNVGGAFGQNSGTIQRVNSFSDVNGTNQVGGLIGANTGLVSFSSAKGNIGGDTDVGGLIGNNSGYQTGDLNFCYADINVFANTYAGGLVGTNDSAIITNSYSTGTVRAALTPAGGIIGYAISPKLFYSFSSSDVYTQGQGVRQGTGGLVGYLYYPGGGGWQSIRDCYSTGKVIGNNQYVGGILGISSSTSSEISRSYSTGDVNGTGTIGGLVGAGGDIYSSFSTSKVNGNGFAGTTFRINSASFWDIFRSGTATPGSCTVIPSTCLITGKNNGNSDPTWPFYYTNTPMSSWGTWTASGSKYTTGIWSICNGASYPFLAWENRTC